MTDKEAMAKELEELAGKFSEGWHEGIKIDASDIMLLSQAAEVLAQPEQEPVAVKRMKEWVEFLKRQSDNGQHMNIPSSFGAGTCWELAIELEQFINTHPPQRTWVGLTDEEISEAYVIASRKALYGMGATREDVYEAIEAKLKEKNT
jgi:hypothetical protein